MNGYCKLWKWMIIALMLGALPATAGLALPPAETGEEDRLPARPEIYYSALPESPPRIDGHIGRGEWSGADVITFSHGTIHVLNDATALYLLLDVTGDTVNSENDYFSVIVDVNGDGEVTAGTDLLFGIAPRSARLVQSSFISPGTTTAYQECGSFTAKGFGESGAHAKAHRIWEIAISLREIGKSPSSRVRMGFWIGSDEPSLNIKYPENALYDFTYLKEIQLASAWMDLIILTHESFLSALKPLQDHKQSTGMITYLQSWQDINELYETIGRDEAERVKYAMEDYDRYYYASYYLLVGDSDLFPVRYTMTDRATAAAYNRAFYPTDLYYADLYKPGGAFDTWDNNQNGYFGELHGETITGPVNVDNVTLVPDVFLGRIPASSSTEVTTYVNKVIAYEYNAYNSNWYKRALLTATTDWVANACSAKETIANSYLTGFATTKLYQSGNPCTATAALNATNINNSINNGLGFFNYIGHGSSGGLALPGGYGSAQLAGLTNTEEHPVVFSSGCDTALFATLPPYDPYTDANGTHHNGTAAGEVFTAVPPNPGCLQTADNPDSFMEQILLKQQYNGTGVGAIGYVGCVTGSQPMSIDLDKAFFESLTYSAKTLGSMWNFMVNRYYQIHPDPGNLGAANWVVTATFHQPWKFFLFGDPSLRLGGVSYFQKPLFLGTYAMNHDDWKGTLSLQERHDDYIEQIPNIQGTYIPSSGGSHDVRGYVRTWNYPLDESWGPDHFIQFYIDFYDTVEHSDDQKFEGYLFTQTKDAIAGITYWNNTPFGFYCLNQNSAKTGTGIEFSTLPAAVEKADFAGVYEMHYDGWRGTLVLQTVKGDYIEQIPNITGTFLRDDGEKFGVRGVVRSADYPLPAEFGPDHKIMFYIDFYKTANTGDDQPFEGYLFTHNKGAMAGKTTWHGTPFGFYAIKVKENQFFSLGGYLGIGTTAPQRAMHLNGGNAVFRMDRPSDASAFLMVRTDAAGAVQKGFLLGTEAVGTNEGHFVITDTGTSVADGAGTARLTIENDGTATFSGDVKAKGYVTTSTARLKENIVPLENPAATLSLLNGVRFRWKTADSAKAGATGAEDLGFIAEAVGAVVPEAVKSNFPGTCGVEYGKLLAVAMETLKQQQRQLDEVNRLRNAVRQQLDQLRSGK